MSKHLESQALTFSCQPDQNLLSLKKIADKTDTGLIVDLSQCAEPVTVMEDFELNSLNIKLSWSQFCSPHIRRFLMEKKPLQTWVECLPDSDTIEPKKVLSKLPDIYPGEIHLVTGDLRLINHCLQHNMPEVHLALKGTESSGFSGGETCLTLVSYAEELIKEFDFQGDISIWGGICTPEASAALLASGARRIIFEHILLLTDLSICINKQPLRQRLEKLRIGHTTLLQISSHCSFRAHNRGNSSTVSEAADLYHSTRADKKPTTIISQHLTDRLTQLHLSTLDNTELIPLGVEAAYAQSFSRRYGQETEKAIEQFSLAVQTCLSSTKTTIQQFQHSPLTKEFRCTHPFIQGGMACITDVPAFALAVSKAGGLPTIALGIKNIRQIEEDLAALSTSMDKRPYAVNIITLPENPYLEEQLDWLRKNRPPFVVISAGSPLFARQLQDEGLSIIYVTADEHLLQMAWENNIRYVVCEGHEAGGHVGHHSTLTLAQAALEIRHNNTNLSDKPIILAGGIFNSATTFRAAMLGASAIQLGTAYLATKEIVELKAMVRSYQKRVLSASFGDTTVTGQAIGLGVRAINSPVIEKIKQLEQNFVTSGNKELFNRKQLERISIGSLAIAARSRRPGSTEDFSEKQCYQQGQYMCGANAGGLTAVLSVAELHDLLAAAEITTPLSKKQSHPTMTNITDKTRIAITAMAQSNALGNSPDESWQASLAMKCGITEIPSHRWDHSKYFSTILNTPGKTYCRVGAFQSLDITRQELGISPHDFRTMSDSTKLTLWLASKVIPDSGLLDSTIPKERIGVIIAQNSGETATTIEDLTLTVKADEIAENIQQQLNLDPINIEIIAEIIGRDRISIDDTTLLGRLSCTAGGFICNKYNFRGPSFAVTAACATGLVALYNAIQLIHNDILDIAIVGGGEELLHPASFLEFSALQALAGKESTDSSPQTSSRPFDARRDGMVLGEGGAMIIIERESSAIKRKAPIHAYITGIGASNNNMGMVESVAETQEIAIAASFANTSYGPSEVDLVECHATATPTGDTEEVKALKSIYPKDSGVILSSFKSQIGHTLGASGLNSLIRGVCAMDSGIYPPTLSYDSPDPDIDLESFGFRVCHKPEIWPHNNARPKRFQVNAFGFGGANYVVQLEQADWDPDVANKPCPDFLSRNKQPQATEAFSDINFFTTTLHNHPYRIGTSGKGHTQNTVTAELEHHLVHNKDLAQPLRSLNKKGIVPALAKPPEQLAFIFAGQGTHYSQMGKELYEKYPTIRYWMDKIADLADFDILHILFKSEEKNLRKTIWQQPALFVLEYSIYRQLKELGVTPNALAGHSMGELTALAVANVFSYQDAFKIISLRASCMEKASKLVDDPGSMIAVDVPLDVLRDLMSDTPDLYYTNYNSPHQTVIGGPAATVIQFQLRLEKRKFWNHILPVSMAFHSPIMRIIRDELGDYLADIHFHPPQIPVLSNTTGKPYPDDIAEIRKIIITHLESPVHWQDNITTMHQQLGITFFVEIGPRDTLCKLLDDIVPQCGKVCTCYPQQETDTFRQTVATLFSLGHLKPLSKPQNLTLTVPKPHNKEEISRIIQQEINSFALQGVEKFLKPAILRTIQQKIDSSFSIQDLTQFFNFGTQNNSALPTQFSVDSSSERRITSPDNTESTVEKLIAIIMEATGYERSEIEPDMDIRQDLSIRSSRLPIIMDAAERLFSITIRLEDFMEVKTIAEFAAKIDEVRKENPQTTTHRPAPGTSVPDDKLDSEAGSSVVPELVKRMVFRNKELSPAMGKTISVAPGSHIVLLSLGNEKYATEIRHHLEQNMDAHVTQLSAAGAENNNTLNLCDHQAVIQAIKNLHSSEEFCGIIMLSSNEIASLEQKKASSYCTGLFLFLQKLLSSNNRQFCIHLRLAREENSLSRLIADSMLGSFLAAKIEYQGMLLRSVLVKDLPDMKEIFDFAFDSRQPLLDLTLEEGTLQTRELFHSPLSSYPQDTLPIDSSSVLMVTGGARGVTARVAQSFGSLGCTLLLLGRSPYPVDINYSALPGKNRDLLDYIAENWPDLDGEERQKQLKLLKNAREIDTNITAMRRAGATVEYIPCDITQPDQVTDIAQYISDKYTHVDGIIHGAATLWDSFIRLMDHKHFQHIVDVKLTGLMHLVEAFSKQNLRFIVGLSSIAAITGNVGQANYCCANRAMAAYLEEIHRSTAIMAKTFWLPPVEGAGMADDPDIRDLILLKIGGQPFVKVADIAEIIFRETLFGPPDESTIVVVRQFPPVQSQLTEKTSQTDCHGWLDCTPLPMVDRVHSADLGRGYLFAERVFEQDSDLWLEDHKPFTWLQHPIVSAIMIVETIFEAAQLLQPHLHLIRLENIQFDRILECPPGTGTTITISCRMTHNKSGETICSVTLGKGSTDEEISQDQAHSYASGNALFTQTRAMVKTDTTKNINAPQTAIMERTEIEHHYQKHSGLTGRYRVLDTIQSVTPASISGTMIYPEISDFSTLKQPAFKYPHYLLEGLMQLAGFHTGINSPDKPKVGIPSGIKKLTVYKSCATGEELFLKAEIIEEEPDCITWLAQGFDRSGELILEVSELTMKWLN